MEDKEITILGDLNCDFLKSASHTTQLLDILAENNLQQLINKPARITSGGESLIDVMITSCEAGHWETGCEDCCLSDHQMIYGIKTEVTNSDGNMLNISQYRAFHKCDKMAFQRDLENVPWQVLETFDDIDDRWYHWKQLFISILDEHVPLKMVRCRRKQVSWISEEMREMMKIKKPLVEESKANQR